MVMVVEASLEAVSLVVAHPASVVAAAVVVVVVEVYLVYLVAVHEAVAPLVPQVL